MIPALCEHHDAVFADLTWDDIYTPDDLPLIAQSYARTCPDCQDTA